MEALSNYLNFHLEQLPRRLPIPSLEGAGGEDFQQEGSSDVPQQVTLSTPHSSLWEVIMKLRETQRNLKVAHYCQKAEAWVTGGVNKHTHLFMPIFVDIFLAEKNKKK